MNTMWGQLYLFFSMASRTPSAIPASPSHVEIHRDSNDTVQLFRNGKPFVIKGVGGTSHLRHLVKSGGNSLRTWSTDPLKKLIDGKPFLDRCHELGIAVTIGLWIKHERHGANYHDENFIQKQRDAIRAAVQKYKAHPAILIWGLGNEMEGPSAEGTAPTIWKELNQLAALIKKEDKNHPVMTVIAGAIPTKIRNLQRHTPNIDILGINAYGPAVEVGDTLRNAQWEKPFVLTEFGPRGHWEVRKTRWRAPLEPSSREKARSYESVQGLVQSDWVGRCLGSYAFFWGSKQETTSTWFGMFLPSGEKLPPVDVMSKAWTGEQPSTRCPDLASFESPLFKASVPPGSDHTAKVIAHSATPLTYEWIVTQESTDRKEGGDFETTPPSHPECLLSQNGNEATIRVPTRPGAYRLFVTIRDGKGAAATENIPFRVTKSPNFAAI